MCTKDENPLYKISSKQSNFMKQNSQTNNTKDKIGNVKQEQLNNKNDKE